jgi:hypothetical protein
VIYVIKYSGGSRYFISHNIKIGLKTQQHYLRPSENRHEGDIAKLRDMVAPPGGLKHIEGDREIHLFSPTNFKNQLDSLRQAMTFPL